MRKLRNPRLVVCASLLFSTGLILASCGNPSGDSSLEVPATYDVTFYHGDEVLKTEQVEAGQTATDWIPEVEGYTFEGWYGTPTFTHAFDFANPINENTSVFGKFVSEVSTPDTRDFYIVGSGTSPVLLESNWGKTITDDMKLTKAAEKNEYTITLDLYEGDQFQFAINSSWENQRGVGYMREFMLGDEEVFHNPGSAYGNDARRSNIQVVKSGNYSFTLTTHPDTDYYDTENPNYKEEGKENFNLNDYDTITWVRNGDVSEVVEAITTFYIKGSGVTKWGDVYNAHTRMASADGTHTLSIYLKEKEEFLFTSTSTVGDKVTTGTEYLRYSNLDETSKAYLDATASYNMVAKASGTYTFTYVESTKALSAAFVAGEMVPTDYYIDGTFGEAEWNGYCFNDAYKLKNEEGTDVYSISNVALKVDSQFILQAFKAGSTERGEWGTEGYNGLGSYNFTYLMNPGENFSAVGGGNNNIKVLVAGNYDVTFDAYAKQITVKTHVEEELPLDVYVKGTMTGWKVLFDDPSWKLAQSATNKAQYDITVALEVNAELGLAVYESGVTEGYGTWVGKDNLGTSGDKNDKFDVTGYNIKCTESASYRIVYDSVASTIDFYAA